MSLILSAPHPAQTQRLIPVVYDTLKAYKIIILRYKKRGSHMKRSPTSTLLSAVLYAVAVFTFVLALVSCGSGGGGGGTATLRWGAPASYENGSPLNPKSDIAIYMIYYGTSTRNYSQTILVANPGETTITHKLNLSSGTYYFAVTAVDTRGRESNLSEEVSKTIN